jgi:hypothetical protein
LLNPVAKRANRSSDHISEASPQTSSAEQGVRTVAVFITTYTGRAGPTLGARVDPVSCSGWWRQ